MTAEVINAKQGLTRIPTYAELIKEIDREKFKTNDIGTLGIFTKVRRVKH